MLLQIQMSIGLVLILAAATVLAAIVALATFKEFRKKLWSAIMKTMDKAWIVLAVVFVCIIVYRLMFFAPQTRYLVDDTYCESDADCYAYTHRGSPDYATCDCECYPTCSNRRMDVDCKDECNVLCFGLDPEGTREFQSPYDCLCIDNKCQPARNVTMPCEYVCNDVIDRWKCNPEALKNYEAEFTRFGMPTPFSRNYNQTWADNNCFNIYNCSCPMFGPEGVV